MGLCFELASSILTLTCKPTLIFGDQTGFQLITQIKPDISEYATFPFYSWVWYWDEVCKFKQVGRWLGVAETIGPIMTFWILPISGIPSPKSTVIPIPKVDLENNLVKNMLNSYDNTINSKMSKLHITEPSMDPVHKYVQNFSTSTPNRTVEQTLTSSDLWDGDVAAIPFEPTSEESALEELDEYIGAQIPLDTKNGPVLVKIKSRKRDGAGILIGRKHDVPVLDTRIYNVQFPDGHYEQYSTNIIAESLTSSYDHDGYDKNSILEICGYRKDENIAVSRVNGFFLSSNGNKHPKITTKGWEIRIRWNDNSTTWVPLNLVKNGAPLLLAEYAKAMRIHLEPAFLWWVPHTLRHKSRLVSKVKTIFHKNNLKFGLEVPRNVAHALQLDKENNNDFWKCAIDKEMSGVKVAFKFLEKGVKAPVGFKGIHCHIIFDVKMDLTRKARFVAGGHMTDPPTSMTYASVVSRESVRIALLLASLNNVELLAGDITLAYLNAPTQEKLYYVAGDEWGPEVKGRVLVIVRALYGLKSSANAWRTFFCQTLKNDMGFDFSMADNDFWMRKDTKPDGTLYYSYILVYVDDILIVSHNPMRYMEQLKSSYCVKPESIGVPKLYLGSEIKQVRDRSGNPSWATSSNKYVKEACSIVDQRMTDMNMSYTKKAKSPKTPFNNVKYRPELDLTPFCTPTEHQFYQQMIGILRWMIELGRIDISTEVSLMSRYLAQPRVGHMIQVLHIFSFLKSNECMDLTYDATKLVINENTILPHETASYKAKTMKTLYPDAIDYIPPNMPTPLGKSIQINAFVDSDLAGEQTTRRSQTGILIYCNMAPIIWFSKRQNTVEASTFGAEFVAMRTLIEMVIGLRYKLRMFGIPIDGPCNIFCDNQAVTKSSMNPDATIKKKHISIAFHQAREAIAAGIALIFFETSKTNHADLFTKVMNSIDRHRLMSLICGKAKQ